MRNFFHLTAFKYSEQYNISEDEMEKSVTKKWNFLIFPRIALRTSKLQLNYNLSLQLEDKSKKKTHREKQIVGCVSDQKCVL